MILDLGVVLGDLAPPPTHSQPLSGDSGPLDHSLLEPVLVQKGSKLWSVAERARLAFSLYTLDTHLTELVSAAAGDVRITLSQ